MAFYYGNPRYGISVNLRSDGEDSGGSKTINYLNLKTGVETSGYTPTQIKSFVDMLAGVTNKNASNLRMTAERPIEDEGTADFAITPSTVASSSLNEKSVTLQLSYNGANREVQWTTPPTEITVTQNAANKTVTLTGSDTATGSQGQIVFTLPASGIYEADTATVEITAN